MPCEGPLQKDERCIAALLDGGVPAPASSAGQQMRTHDGTPAQRAAPRNLQQRTGASSASRSSNPAAVAAMTTLD